MSGVAHLVGRQSGMTPQSGTTDGAQASVDIQADPQVVYELVSDVPGLPRWAAETVSCRWVDVDGPRVGARFRGLNRRGPLVWRTMSAVTEADPGRAFAWRVTAFGSPIAAWRYDIEPTAEGCRVTESTTDLRNAFFRRIVGPIGTGVTDRAEHNRRNIEATLQNLKTYAESERASS
jgi:Polyketide cyclase / dehydrase and lipid transport